MLPGQLQRLPIAAPQQFGFPVLAIPPDRTDRVDNVPGWQPVARSDPGLPSRATAERTAFLQQLGTGCPVDRTIHPAAAQEGLVGRVNDGVHPEGGDIGTNGGNHVYASPALARLLLFPAPLGLYSLLGPDGLLLIQPLPGLGLADTPDGQEGRLGSTPELQRA